MANDVTNETASNVAEDEAKKQSKPKKQQEKKELNLDAKVTVRNIAGWQVGFDRKADGIGSVRIMADGTMRLSRNEIIAQVHDGNKLITGVDGRGSHATLVIEDAPTRVEVDFESEDGSRKQAVFSDELVKKLFDIPQQDRFESEFKNAIVTRAERYAVMQSINRQNLNDYRKIRFIENYTGNRLI